jgi:hypothetical protein
MPGIVLAAVGPGHPRSSANTARSANITINGSVAAPDECCLLLPAQQ